MFIILLFDFVLVAANSAVNPVSDRSNFYRILIPVLLPG